MSENSFNNCTFNAKSIKVGDKTSGEGACISSSAHNLRGSSRTPLYMAIVTVLVIGGALFLVWPSPTPSTPRQAVAPARPVVGQATLDGIRTAAMKLPDKQVDFIRSYTYQASEDDSKKSARAKATLEVKRLLLEELGNYISCETFVEDGMLEKDSLYATSAGLVKLTIQDEKWNGKNLWIKATMKANPRAVVLALRARLKDGL